MNNTYPKIKLADALAKTNGNQAELGRELGYQRAYINELVRTKQEFLPEVAAWRFVNRFGEAPEAEQSAA